MRAAVVIFAAAGVGGKSLSRGLCLQQAYRPACHPMFTGVRLDGVGVGRVFGLNSLVMPGMEPAKMFNARSGSNYLRFIGHKELLER